HCAHGDDVAGEPLDPRCNECVTRVCDVDPTCCGAPGPTFYPGSLVWGARCIKLREQVCHSAPDLQTWPAGNAAPAAGTTRPLPKVVRGVIGSFEGFDQAGALVGWACDPDFPGAPVPIQVSIGTELGQA